MSTIKDNVKIIKTAEDEYEVTYTHYGIKCNIYEDEKVKRAASELQQQYIDQRRSNVNLKAISNNQKEEWRRKVKKG